MGKIKTIVIFAAGYVVGARAGHKRYEQIRDWVQEMWNKPAVQEQVDNATGQAGKLAREAKGHLPGSKKEDKDQTNQDSTEDPYTRFSGQASDSTSTKSDSSESGSESDAATSDSTDSDSTKTRDSPQKPDHG